MEAKIKQFVVISNEMKEIAQVGELVSLDAPCDPDTQVEILPDLGFPGMYKLYVHVGGVTVIRLCRIPEDAITQWKRI